MPAVSVARDQAVDAGAMVVRSSIPAANARMFVKSIAVTLGHHETLKRRWHEGHVRARTGPSESLDQAVTQGWWQ